MVSSDEEIDENRLRTARASEAAETRKSRPAPSASASSTNNWVNEPWKPEYMSSHMLEESSFATLFPAYREAYLKENWPSVTRILKKEGIACELNLLEGSMTVKTTRKTTDPYIIMKARDLIKLLARSIPLERAKTVLEDDVHADVIKIGGFVRNKERFIKRRQRLVGTNGQTLKAIELLTNCYVLVQGNTVSCLGSFGGIKQVRSLVEDCMKNVHPIYGIKRLMIMKELAKDPLLKNESWERFLPTFSTSTKHVQTKRPKKKKQKEYSPFPPEREPSKLDKELESGEYFLKDAAKRAKKQRERKERSVKKSAERQKKRLEAFVVPKEDEDESVENQAERS